MKQRSGLRVRLLMLVLVAVLPVFGISVYWAFDDQRADLEQAKGALQTAANMEAARQSRTVESTRQLLIAMAGAAELRSGSEKACQEYLIGLRDIMPAYNNLGVMGLTGRLRCGAQTKEGVLLDPEQVAHFRGAIRTRKFSVGDYFVGVVSGKPILGFGYPLVDGAGALTGVVFAAIRLQDLQQEMAGVALPDGVHMTLLDRNRRVLASTDILLKQGSVLPPGPLRERIEAGATGIEDGPAIPGPQQIHAFAPTAGIAGKDLFVVASVNREVVTGPTQARMVQALLALAFFAMVGAVLAWIYAGRAIVGPAHDILDATARLQAGDLATRLAESATAATEFERISIALNRMAQALEQREQALQAALAANAAARATQELVLNTMQEGVVAIDADRNYLLFNHAASRIFQPAERPSELPWTQPALTGIFKPGTQTLFRADELPLYRALLGESGSDFDLFVRNEVVPEGRLIRGNYRPVVGPSGIVGALGVFTDITDRDRLQAERLLAEAELHETQRKLLEAQRIGRIGNWESDAKSRRFWLSDEVYELFGVERSEFDASFAGFARLVHPDDQQALRAARDAALAGAAVLDREFRVVLPAIGTRWMQVRGEARIGADGQVLGLAGVVQDIHERKAGEAARAAAERELAINAQRLAWLAEVQAELADASASGDELVGKVAEMAARITGAHGAEFELIEGDEFVLSGSAGKARHEIGVRRPVGKLTREAMASGHNIRCDDVEQDSRVLADWCRQYGVRSLVATILRVDGAPIGAFAVLSPDVCGFTDADAHVLQLLADFLGSLFHRKRAEQAAAEHLFTLQRAADAAEAIVFHHSLRDTMKEVAEQLRAVIPSHQSLVTLVDGGEWGKAVNVMSLSSRDAPLAARLHAPDDASFAALVCDTRRVLRLRRAELLAHPRWRPYAAPGSTQPPANGLLAIPLTGRDGRILGVMQLRDKIEGEFTLQDEYVAVEMAQLVSVAIENARLFDEISHINQNLEQKVAERSRELARQEAVFRAAADQAPQTMWIVNTKGAVTYLNRSWYDLVGGAAPKWLGHEWMDAVDPDDVAEMRRGWAVSAVDHSIFSGIRRVDAVDGKVHTLAYRASPVYDESGQITCWVGMDADITESKSIETALRQANDELEAFSYSVSHDLRSPLGTIDGFSRLLEKDLKTNGGKKADHYIARILASAGHMGQLIEGLLALAQISRQQLQLSVVDVSAMSEEIAERLARQQPERQVHVTIEPGLLARADPRLLRAVLENLLGNAWKFSSRCAAASITVGSAPHGKGHGFFVRDNGVGFDMAYSTKLFGAFERLHAQADFPGTGIGLATVKRIVTRHGGTVWAESEPGHGAAFFFTLGGAEVAATSPSTRPAGL
jgi:PAS domain S-box-containing protein